MNHPIIRRELISFLRTRRAVALQVALATAFALLVALHWPTDGQVDLSGARSREVFRVLGYGLLAAAILLGPIFPATSIVRDRLQGTLELVLISPMSPWSIYCGKLFGILGLVLVLLSMSFPAAAACYAMGGISLTHDVLQMFGLLVLIVLQYCSVALLVSSYATSTDSAVRMTYGIVLLMSVVTLVPYQFLQGTGGALVTVATWVRCVSPIPVFLELLGQRDVGTHGLTTAAGTTIRYLLITTFSTAGLMVWTISRLNQRMLDRPRPQGKITNDLSTTGRLFRRLLYIVDPQRRKSGIAWYVNPVMVKEFRCRRFGRIHWLLRMVAVCSVLSLTLTVLTTTGTMSWGVETIGAIMVVLQVALVILIAPSLAAGLISTERESGGWDLLRMTPLSTRRILIGKLLSAVWPVLLILLATLPGYIVMYFIQPSIRDQIIRVIVCLVLTAVLGILLSAAVGSLFRQTATATVTSYSLLLLIYAGTMLIWLGRDFPFSHSTVETALTANPMAAAFSVIEVGGFERYELVPGNWWFIGTASAAMLVLLIVQTWRLTRPG